MCETSTENKPIENLIEAVVKKLQREHKFSQKAVSRTPHSSYIRNSVKSSKQGTIKPMSPLTEELRDWVWDISIGVSIFYVMKRPSQVLFCH